MLDKEALKLLTDAGAVVILAIVLFFVIRIIANLVGAFISVMNQYVSALQESNKQTALIRQSMVRMDKRHADLLLGNNSIVHLTYEKVGGLETLANEQASKLASQIQTHEVAAGMRHQTMLAAIAGRPLTIITQEMRPHEEIDPNGSAEPAGADDPQPSDGPGPGDGGTDR